MHRGWRTNTMPNHRSPSAPHNPQLIPQALQAPWLFALYSATNPLKSPAQTKPIQLPHQLFPSSRLPNPKSLSNTPV